MWVRGLKLVVCHALLLLTPVAPHVGAWIETAIALQKYKEVQSHPMWVRGLKLTLDDGER